MSPTIIGSREHSYELSTCEPFEPIHNTFMSSNNHAEVIVLKERLNAIRAELDNMSSPCWVTDNIGLNS